MIVHEQQLPKKNVFSFCLKVHAVTFRSPTISSGRLLKIRGALWAKLCCAKKQFAFGERRVDYDWSTSTVVMACAAEVDHGVNLFDDC